jgi:cytoskeletal protein RodZ
MEEDKSVLGLATIRRNRGVSLEQIADATKISMRSLQAIEGGDFKKLPGGIYNTNYIRQYAQAIDFDASALLDYYNRQMGATSENVSAPAPKKNNIGGGFRPSAIFGL